MKPLEGIRVLDLTTILPWEYTTLALAELGAEVIKIEPPDGTATRRIPPIINGESILHRWFNRQKKSIVINLRKKSSYEALMKLVERSDILVEAYTSKTAERLGITYENTSAQNEKIIHCSIRAFEEDSEYDAGHDINVLSLTGGLSLIVDENNRPVIPGLLIADFSCAYTVLSVILASLIYRERTGKGRHVRVSMSSALIPFFSHSVAQSILTGEQPSRENNILMGLIPAYNIYETRDGRFISIGIPTEKHLWREFCEKIGHSEFIDRQFDTSLVRELREIFKTKNLDEWMHVLKGVRCVTPVLTLREAFENGFMRSVITWRNFDENYLKTPFTAYEEYARAPALGENTREILTSLGYSEEEIAEITS